MKTKFVFRFIKVFATATYILVLFCTQAIQKRTLETIQPGATLYMEIKESDSLTICWDSPATDADLVNYYELSYRTERNNTFVLLKNIPASVSPSVIVHRNEVDSTDSVFYFRVRSVTKSGLNSDFHFSSDSDAVPEGGWFLLWKLKM